MLRFVFHMFIAVQHLNYALLGAENLKKKKKN